MPAALQNQLRNALIGGIILRNEYACTTDLCDFCGLLGGKRYGRGRKSGSRRDFRRKVDSSGLAEKKGNLDPKQGTRTHLAYEPDLTTH